jgi:hypothetical protein
MSDNDYTELREALTEVERAKLANSYGTGAYERVRSAEAVACVHAGNAAPTLLAEVDELRAYKARAERARDDLTRWVQSPLGEIPEDASAQKFTDQCQVALILTDWSRDE